MNRLQRLLCDALKAHLDGAKPRPPEGAGLLWDAFLRLSATRTYHQFGANPISFTEIEAFARLMALPLQPHHVRALCEMDAVYLDHFASQRGTKAPSGVKTVPRESRGKLSPALFDAMMG